MENLSTFSAEKLDEALYHGTVLRVRPKAMTVAVIIAGLLPVLGGTSAGSEYCRAAVVAIYHSGSLQADVAAQVSPPDGIACAARLRRQTTGGALEYIYRPSAFTRLRYSPGVQPNSRTKSFMKRGLARITYRLCDHYHRQCFARQGLGGDLQAQRR
nr:cation transporter [Salmonella sp. NCTC 7297]